MIFHILYIADKFHIFQGQSENFIYVDEFFFSDVWAPIYVPVQQCPLQHNCIVLLYVLYPGLHVFGNKGETSDILSENRSRTMCVFGNKTVSQ